MFHDCYAFNEYMNRVIQFCKIIYKWYTNFRKVTFINFTIITLLAKAFRAVHFTAAVKELQNGKEAQGRDY